MQLYLVVKMSAKLLARVNRSNWAGKKAESHHLLHVEKSNRIRLNRLGSIKRILSMIQACSLQN